ncbi:SAM-dependent methyltransferase [Prauserella cavernicola]|uniref:SAM-dependent methyltransferase n=1 Tax=Prauserella cavernicola TaxID=2800127 RepID=A0A934V2P1_9PSEU|nr:SAM-dependent methyltransferase [Prauserella cavernicola]MBK1783297.1 SAM-dependent methyltransferase [Prauserella cavernicola]
MPNATPPPDLERPSAGRIYDYLLGGTTNYAVDREFAEQQLSLAPGIRESARANRRFLGRAVRYAIDLGIRQFVDIGSGLPTQGNVHEVADEAAPEETRVVYIDNEPIAHAHAQILLEDTADPERHRAIAADYFDGPDLWRAILDEDLIDPSQPVCLLAVALLHFMPDEQHPERPLAFYRDKLAPGSMLVLSHGSVDAAASDKEDSFRKVRENYNKQATHKGALRSNAEVTALFGDFEIVEPGVVWLDQWRPDGVVNGDPARTGLLAGVGLKH